MYMNFPHKLETVTFKRMCLNIAIVDMLYKCTHTCTYANSSYHLAVSHSRMHTLMHTSLETVITVRQVLGHTALLSFIPYMVK